MKRLKKAGIVISLMALMTVAFTTNASAATVSDGIKAEITVTSQDSERASVEAVVKNANYYGIDGISCKLSVSDNAVLSGEDVKTDLELTSEQSESLKADISLKESGETQPDATETQPSNNHAQASTQPTTQPKDSTTITTADTTGKSAIKTGQDDNIMLIVALCFIAFAVALGVSFKKKNRRMMSLLLCLCLALSIGTVGVVSVNAAEGESISVITDELIITLNGTYVTVTFTVEYPEQPEIHDNTPSDLQSLNGDSFDAADNITYNDRGEISFLNGKYTDYKVINLETAMSSLQALETLLNAKENDISLIPVSVKSSDNGDTYYTFQQNVGAVILSESYITVGADKDGNTLCFSSSLQPDAGVEALEGNIITAEQADEIADKLMAGQAERTEKEPVFDYDSFSSKLCWVVYRKIISSDAKDSEKSQYLKLYITANTGELLKLMYLSDIEDYRTDKEVYDNDIFFQTETEMMTFTDYHGNQVELPVAKTETGSYYFCDTERRIICADTDATQKIGFTVPVFYEFNSADEVSSVYVSVFNNMRKIYDSYAEIGLESIDGNGLPLMICFGYKQYGKEIENACYASNLFGWGTFIFSNTYISTPIDVAAHEFTHGVKANITGLAAYQNITGAIEESYADIIGNLTEMLIDTENSDTETWTIAESSGKPIRNMSNPHIYSQPEYVGDAYFLMECNPASDINDKGGVHINNSILSKICYDMYKSGIDMEELRDIWINTFLVFNSNADFDDVLGYLKFIVAREGKDEYIDIIQQLFEKANAVDANTESWEGYPVPEGYAKITVNGHDFPEGLDWSVRIHYGEKDVFAYKDANGITSTVLDKENVILTIRYQDDMNEPIKNFLYKPKNEEGYNLAVDKDEVIVDFSYNDLILIE